MNCLRTLFTKMRHKISKKHAWREIRHGVRQCDLCQRVDYLGEKRFPEIGEAKYAWLLEGAPCRPESID